MPLNITLLLQLEYFFNILFTVVKEVNKIWGMEKGTGFIIGKVSTFSFTDEDIRSLNDKNWLTDQVN